MTPTLFTLPNKCRIETVTIKKTFGPDEEEALLSAENNGSDPKDELIDLSIVAVDGVNCLPGASGFDKWPTKTRAVVKRFFSTINDTDGTELAPLIEEAEENGTSIVDGNTHTRYGFPADCELSHVVLKEMMEEDERAGSAAGKNVTAVMISRCVVSTSDGDGFTTDNLHKLCTRARNILTVYWTGMNFVPEGELVPLIKAAEAVRQTVKQKAVNDASVAGSLQNGSGSPAPADAV